MAARKKSPAKGKDRTPGRQKPRARGAESSASSYLESSGVVEIGVFALFLTAVSAICFLGQRTADPRFVEGYPAPERIVSEYDFSYSSEIRRQQQIDEITTQQPPVVVRTYEPFNRFREFLETLNASVARTQIENESLEAAELEAAVLETAEQLVAESGYDLPAETLLRYIGSSRESSALAEEALAELKALYEDGIHSRIAGEDGGTGRVALIQIVDESGNESLPNARSLEDAEVSLRVRLNSISQRQEDARLLFKIFRQGLEPNLVYSKARTDEAVRRAVAGIEAPKVTVAQGETVIEPGRMVDAAAVERLNAYRKVASEYESDNPFTDVLFLKRSLLTLLLLGALLAVIKIELRATRKRNRAIAVTAVAILINLLIIRGLLELGEMTLRIEGGSQALRLLTFAAPFALAPIIVAVLVGTGPALVSSLVVSVLFGIMRDGSIPYFLIAFVSGVTGSLAARSVRKRGSVVRAGLLTGAVSAFSGALVGLLAEMSFGLVGQVIVSSLLAGLLTGVLAVGLIPVLEHLFNISTEITLLELTDFNHPLLRRMQVEAPGTYHHSLMVANLSENAAGAIGARPLVCRACALYHDIGKLVKPEFFVENQRDGINPHQQQNPSMSALVIKAHVKEGVELARAHKLPRVIHDVIRQHHGTSLIHYFYSEARKRQQKGSRSPLGEKGGPAPESIDESTYRYDGPRPRFKESAIIFFADACEAASRSLKKVSQPAIEELLDSIFNERIEDGQLDECPLTFQEVKQIKRSFVFTLLNMLHTRIEYPKDEAAGDKGGSTARPPREDEAAAAEAGPREAAANGRPEAAGGAEAQAQSTGSQG